MVGGGPRAVSQATAEVMFQHIYAHHFSHLHSLGAEYHLRTTIIERQSLVGVGASCCQGQTGMMNTGIESDITFPLPLSNPTAPALSELLSYRQRYQRMLEGRQQEYYQRLLHVNLPGAVMFQKSLSARSSTPEGCLDHTGAYLMRTTVGEEEYRNFKRVTQLAESLPFYQLHVLDSSYANSLTIGSDGVHRVNITRAREQRDLEAGMVRLNTGTTTKNPIPDPAVRNIAFCDLMNAHHFRRHCEKRNLLSDDGLLKPGVRMLSGGVCLSGLDQISVLNHVMELFETDHASLLGYRVTEAAKARYQGAITLLSRTPGKVVPPRHATGFEWLQGTPTMGRTRHLHALFLHAAGEHVFDMWIDILRANVARASSRTPAHVTHVAETLRGALDVQYDETKWFLECRRKAEREERRGNLEGKHHFVRESSKTLYGAWRQAALSLIFGFGLESDGEAATKEMESYAPLTWKGREIWLFHRAQLKAITEGQFATERSNGHLVKNFQMLMQHITSSPVEVHSMLHLLTESGIAHHEKASYGDISADGERALLHGEEYDGVLVSPVFERNENAVLGSLVGQVRSHDEAHASYAKVGKFRRLVDRDGRDTAIEDNGLSGKGFWGAVKDGDSSLIGCFATDVNNRASGVSIASSSTLRRMAAGHLSAAGVEDCDAVVQELYEGTKAPEEEFREEVGKFKKDYEEVYEMWAYLEGAKVIAGEDSEYFRVLFDAGLEQTDRKKEMRKLGLRGGVEKEGYMVYKRLMQNMPAFDAVQRDEYYARFVDSTDDEDRRVYEKAYQMAERHLRARE